MKNTHSSAVAFSACVHEQTPEPTAERALQSLVTRPMQEGALAVGAQRPQTFVATLMAELPDGYWQLSDESGRMLPATLARSCLVRPLLGDLVYALRVAQQCWVLHVLASTEAGAPVTLEVKDAALCIQAPDVTVQAQSRLQLEADALSLRSRVATQHSQERQTRVTGTDNQKLGCSITQVERHHAVHARNTLMTAQSLLKLDASQIHMG